jgi:hypothetical protein
VKFFFLSRKDAKIAKRKTINDENREERLLRLQPQAKILLDKANGGVVDARIAVLSASSEWMGAPMRPTRRPGL